MKNHILRGGVVGFGKMGLLHSAIVNVSKTATLCAVAESNGIMRKYCSVLMPQVKFYENFQEMLEKEKLDFVFITTPPSSHIPIALVCHKHNCHFFIEKPLCLGAPSALPLLDALTVSPRVTMVGYMMRYDDIFRRAKEMLDRKVLGRIISFSATTYVSQLFKAGKGWRYDPKESGGGVLITQGIHAIEIMCWFFGMPRVVNARTNSFYSKKVEDFCHVVLAWPNGVTGWLDSSWSVDNHRMFETSFLINGEHGSLIVNDDTLKLYLRQEHDGLKPGWTLQTKPELFHGAEIDIGGPQFTRQDVAFLDAIVSGKVVENDLQNAYGIQNVVDCIYKSAKSDGNSVLIQD